MGPTKTFWLSAAALTGLVVWTYWPSFLAAADRWATDPQYSHGYLVPLFSVYLLWSRRRMLATARQRASKGGDIAAGFALLAFGVGMRWFGTLFYYNGLDLLSLLPTLAGMTLVLGGWPALRWAWPAVGFLVFMVPLPFQLQTAMAGRLQRLATEMSTYTLQMLGAPAVSEGNVILLGDVRIGVVEACSGLGMVVTFAALSAGMALVIRSPLWIRLCLLVGALPIAVLANVARITATGLFYHAGYGETARAVFHDVAGWLMMPVAVALILVERFVLERLTTDAESQDDAHRGGPIPLFPKPARPSARPAAPEAR